MIHLVRHGQTATSGRTFAGRLDVPLTEQGLAEAWHVADTLATFPVGCIFTSPLDRAVRTAVPLAERFHLYPIVLPCLAEFDFGVLEGRPKAEIALSLRKTHRTTPVPGGESLWDLWRRLGEAERRIRHEAHSRPGNDVVVMGHYWTNRLLHARLNGLAFDNALSASAFKPATGSVASLELSEDAADAG